VPFEDQPAAVPATPPLTGAGRAARAFAGRHRRAITVTGSIVGVLGLAWVLAGRRDEFATALTTASPWVLLAAAMLQVVALLARSEAWHVSIAAAGGTVPRRVLYRASSMGYVGSLLNAHVGVAARIAALRRSSPDRCPGVPTLVAAELPIMAVEAVLAAIASFTLVGPLGLPWWLPIVFLVVFGMASTGLRRLAARKTRELFRGLAVLRGRRDGALLVGFVLVAVFAQIGRNWLLLHAVGVDASVLDATAVLIAMTVFSQLPLGPSSGAAAALLILGRGGVAAVAAAGVLTTATGTAGGLAFAAWAGADRLWVHRRDRRRDRRRAAVEPPIA
jgi:uncharacterized membrane protein YbhN (UPF0104 family)